MSVGAMVSLACLVGLVVGLVVPLNLRTLRVALCPHRRWVAMGCSPIRDVCPSCGVERAVARYYRIQDVFDSDTPIDWRNQ